MLLNKQNYFNISLWLDIIKFYKIKIHSEVYKKIQNIIMLILKTLILIIIVWKKIKKILLQIMKSMMMIALISKIKLSMIKKLYKKTNLKFQV